MSLKRNGFTLKKGEDMLLTKTVAQAEQARSPHLESTGLRP